MGRSDAGAGAGQAELEDQNGKPVICWNKNNIN